MFEQFLQQKSWCGEQMECWYINPSKIVGKLSVVSTIKVSENAQTIKTFDS